MKMEIFKVSLSVLISYDFCGLHRYLWIFAISGAPQTKNVLDYLEFYARLLCCTSLEWISFKFI